MKEKVSFFFKNSDQINDLLIMQQKNFESDYFNSKTIINIENFIYNR